MEKSKEIAIKDIYCGKTTVDYKPLYAKHETFVRESRYKLYFRKENENFTEILTGTKITSVIKNLKEAKPGVVSIIDPKPVEKKKFKKDQLEKGTITETKTVVRLYKKQEEVVRDNHKRKVKVKVKTLIAA